MMKSVEIRRIDKFYELYVLIEFSTCAVVLLVMVLLWNVNCTLPSFQGGSIYSQVVDCITVVLR